VSGNRKQFGRNVGRLRSEAGMTQEILAERAEISVRYVQFLEAGRYTPTVLVAARIREALNVRWDDLLKGL